jgi:hypothetical protein
VNLHVNQYHVREASVKHNRGSVHITVVKLIDAHIILAMRFYVVLHAHFDEIYASFSEPNERHDSTGMGTAWQDARYQVGYTDSDPTTA